MVSPFKNVFLMFSDVVQVNGFKDYKYIYI